MARSTSADVQTALITGASSGIGEALARCFARDGIDLVVVARDAEKLKTLAGTLTREFGVKTVPLAVDLSTPEAACRLAATLRRRRVAIDVLVNSAGVLEQGGFVTMKPERVRPMIDLNVGGLTAMLSAFVPPMVERGRGRILNVASIAGFQPVPSLAVYAATKAYVLSLTESLAEELRGSGVTATALCPGITATNMLSTAIESNAQLAGLPAFVIGGVDVVAAEGYRACMRGDVVCLPGALNAAVALAGRAAPKWLVRRVVGAIGRKGI